MVHCYTCCKKFLPYLNLVLLFQVFAGAVHAQLPVNKLRMAVPDSINVDINNPFQNLFDTRPAFKLNGGMVCYNANYRALIDTPYAEKDILQHNITGRLDATVAGIVPLQINYWLRRSNSAFFRNIYDVQVAFNQAAFRENIKTSLKQRMLALAPSVKDANLEKLVALQQTELASLDKLLKTTFSPQKLIEANEMLKVPRLAWDGSLPDSVNQHKEDSLKKAAAYFLEEYNNTKNKYDQLHAKADSLQEKYKDNLAKVHQYQQLIKGDWSGLQSARAWKNRLQEYGLEDVEIPAKYRWLLGLRNFSLGRSRVN